MQLQSIDDVIIALTEIVANCKNAKNRSGYFAALYKRMTIAVKEGVAKRADEIASLFDDVQQYLEDVWLPMKFLKRIGKTQQTDVLNFSIGAARKTAWANAVVLAGMNPNQQHAYIQQMDNMVYQIAQKIIHPGFIAGILLRIIRMSEYDDVARTINLIDTTVVE